MLSLPPKVYVQTYFEERVKAYSPAIRQIIMEDVKNLLEGKSGEFIEGFDGLRDEFLDVCHAYGFHLAVPLGSEALNNRE